MRQKLLTTLFQVYKKLSILMTNPARTAVPIYDKSWLSKCTSELYKNRYVTCLEIYCSDFLNGCKTCWRSKVKTQDLSKVSQGYSHKVLKIYRRYAPHRKKRLSKFAGMSHLYRQQPAIYLNVSDSVYRIWKVSQKSLIIFLFDIKLERCGKTKSQKMQVKDMSEVT